MTISVKFCTEVRGWPAYTAVKNFFRKLQPLSRVHQRYRQTTDRRQTELLQERPERNVSHVRVKMGWFGVVRGHPNLSAMSPFDRAPTTSCSSLIETIRLSCTVYEI